MYDAHFASTSPVQSGPVRSSCTRTTTKVIQFFNSKQKLCPSFHSFVLWNSHFSVHWDSMIVAAERFSGSGSYRITKRRSKISNLSRSTGTVTGKWISSDESQATNWQWFSPPPNPWLIDWRVVRYRFTALHYQFIIYYYYSTFIFFPEFFRWLKILLQQKTVKPSLKSVNLLRTCYLVILSGWILMLHRQSFLCLLASLDHQLRQRPLSDQRHCNPPRTVYHCQIKMYLQQAEGLQPDGKSVESLHRKAGTRLQ